MSTRQHRCPSSASSPASATWPTWWATTAPASTPSDRTTRSGTGRVASTPGRANFRELYAVFSSPRLITVRVDNKEIGQLEAQFLAALQSPEAASACFTLAGRAWLVEHIDWERGVCSVRHAPEGKAPRWNGGAQWLGYDLCQAMGRVLTSDDVPAYWASWAPSAAEDAVDSRPRRRSMEVSSSRVWEDRVSTAWWKCR